MADLAQAAFRAGQPGGQQAALVTGAGTLALPQGNLLFAMAELTTPWTLNEGSGEVAFVPRYYPYAQAKLLRLSQGAGSSREWMPQHEVLVVAPWRTRKETPLDPPDDDVRMALLPSRVGDRLWVCWDRQSGYWLYLGLEREPLLRVRLMSDLPPHGEADAIILQFDSGAMQWEPSDRIIQVHDALGAGAPTDIDVVVQWTWAARRWELIASNLLGIVEITSDTPDPDGYYPGQIVRWTGTGWEAIGSCKVVDLNA